MPGAPTPQRTDDNACVPTLTFMAQNLLQAVPDDESERPFTSQRPVLPTVSCDHTSYVPYPVWPQWRPPEVAPQYIGNPRVDIDGIHDAAFHALCRTPTWNGETPEAIHCYLDGSFLTGRPEDTAWAFLYLVEPEGRHDELLFAGVTAHRLCSSLPLREREEEDELAPWTSLDAEMAAALWALIEASRRFPCAPLTLYTDNTTVQAVVSTYTRAKGCERLSDLVAAGAAFHRRRADLTVQHVHSHRGHPWNELADSAARAVAEGWYTPPPLLGPTTRHLVMQYLDEAQTDWMWLAQATGSEQHSYPWNLLQHKANSAHPLSSKWNTCSPSPVTYPSRLGPHHSPEAGKDRCSLTPPPTGSHLQTSQHCATKMTCSEIQPPSSRVLSP